MIEHRHVIGGGSGVRRRMAFVARNAKFPSGRFQLTPEDPNGPRRVQRQRYPIAGNPADLQNDVIPHVNPFTDFSTKHQHFKNSLPEANSV
jgi:hypothetical protein